VKPSHQITADAVTIRGIIDYLEKSVEPATLHELAIALRDQLIAIEEGER